MNKLNDIPAVCDADSVAGDRTAALSAVADKLRDALEELDRLQVWRVGAHVSQALSDLEIEICASS